MGHESTDVVRSMYEAFGRGDVPAVLGAMTDDIEWHEAEGLPYGGVHHGPEAVAQNVFGPLLVDVPDFTVTPEEFIAAGDTVAVVVRYRGTGAVTGKSLDLPVMHVWDVHDGKAARFRQFVDTVTFLDVARTPVAAASG
jgi:ketosteroid isomerase-like protein